MQYEEITFQGSRSEIDGLLLALSSIEEISSAETLSITGSVSDFLGRNPLNQTELVDVVVNIAINLVSSVIYDQVRQKIDEQAKKKGFKRKLDQRSNSG
jgi:hypothetical protein